MNTKSIVFKPIGFIETPFDIKPYVEAIDSITDSGNGWMDNIK